jgi:hypothetical protein
VNFKFVVQKERPLLSHPLKSKQLKNKEDCGSFFRPAGSPLFFASMMKSWWRQFFSVSGDYVQVGADKVGFLQVILVLSQDSRINFEKVSIIL